MLLLVIVRKFGSAEVSDKHQVKKFHTIKIFETLNLFEALVTAIFRYYLFFQNKVYGYFNMILRLLISIFNL